MHESWLRGTLTELPPIRRALVHSLEMAREDIAKWCGGFSDEEIHARPLGLPSIAFQVRHIARSLDRFCSYAEGHALTPEQLGALGAELEGVGTAGSIFREFEEGLEQTVGRLEGLSGQPLDLAIAI